MSAASTSSWIDKTSRISVRKPDAESTRTRACPRVRTLVASRRQRSAGPACGNVTRRLLMGATPNTMRPMRKRLVQTSRGPVEIEIGQNRALGLWVSVTPFPESGWQARPTKSWWSTTTRANRSPSSWRASCPFQGRKRSSWPPTSKPVASGVGRIWRGGRNRSLERWTSIGVNAVIGVVLLALAWLGLVIWLILT